MSIRFHIVVIMTLFCLVLFLAIWLFQIVFLDDFYRSVKTNAIRDTSKKIVETLPNIEFDANMEMSEFLLQMNSISIQNDACALIANVSTGFSMGANTKRDGCPVSNLSSLSVQSLWNLAMVNQGQWTAYLPEDGFFNLESMNKHYNKHEQQVLIYASTAYDQNHEKVLVVLSTIIKPIHIITDTLKQQLLNVIVIILFCSLLVSFILAKLIANPIRKINEQAKRLAEGNYEPVFNGTGYREIEELSQTLNYAATELSKVDKLRQELIANVSHDLRTPLTMISGYGEVIRDIPNENTPENVQIIIDEANRLSSMVNNLLDISKLQSGNEELMLETVNFTQMIDDIVNRYQKMMESREFEICFDWDQEVEAEIDVTRINQVLYNLLNNAINYSHDSRLVEVKQSVIDGWVRIDVVDHGIGVKEEDLPYIWQRYYKVDKEHKRTVTGSGLGLSIVQTILEKHHFEYGVSSEYGKGSDFYFILPCQTISK
ncbi:MAG: HAMP domain-containing sensor histidine kinase [Erysipelotrichaceae bacterium]|nr:HAMP domain-containing sensor histidine kinase [Erysipelotrichaceae bacterium]